MIYFIKLHSALSPTMNHCIGIYLSSLAWHMQGTAGNEYAYTMTNAILFLPNIVRDRIIYTHLQQ